LPPSALLKPAALPCPAALCPPAQAGKESAKEQPKAKDKAGASKKDDKAAKEKEKAAAALAAQQQPPGKPQQQKRGKDTDKVRDAALRGTAGDETAMLELAAHRENVAKAQSQADKVSSGSMLGLNRGFGLFCALSNLAVSWGSAGCSFVQRGHCR
jgi:hypothetical protein